MKSLYAAFDTFPAPKGAAVHIKHMAETLFDYAQSGMLYAVGGEGLPAFQQEGATRIIRFEEKIPNLLQRAVAFSQQLTIHLSQSAQDLKLCHFRDPWSGFPILNYREAQAAEFKTVYEVNALPSVELPYAFPQTAPSTLAKIAEQEMLCLDNADAVITPSQTTKDFLIDRGVTSGKVTVIRNGADVIDNTARPTDAPERYLIYFGAIQQWQGVDDLLRAFSLLADYRELFLVMCVSKHNRIAKQYRKMAQKLGIDSRIIWRFGLDQIDLKSWINHAELSVAPLTDCPRNTIQGCCPLKILESMAAGVPVVASDLPVVRELMQNGVHGRLVRPGRAPELARVIRGLLEYPQQRKKMGDAARQRIQQDFNWNKARIGLLDVYRKLTG